MPSDDREREIFAALESLLEGEFGDAHDRRTEIELERRHEQLIELVDGTPQVGLSAWSLFTDGWATHSIRTFAPSLDVVDPRSREILDDIGSRDVFAADIPLLIGSEALPHVMVPIAATDSGPMVVVNPARSEDGEGRVVYVDWGEAFFLISAPERREVDNIHERDELPTLAEFIETVVAAHQGGRFEILDSGHRSIADPDPEDFFRYEYPWPLPTPE